MESIIQIFRMDELSIATRINIMKTLGTAINHQFASNITEPLVIELILALDPELESDLRADPKYSFYMED